MAGPRKSERKARDLRRLLRAPRARALSAVLVAVTTMTVTCEAFDGTSTRHLSAALVFAGVLEAAARYFAYRGSRARALLEVAPEIASGLSLFVPASARPAFFLLRYARSLRLFGLLEPSLRDARPGSRALVRVALAVGLAATVGTVALWTFERTEGGAGSPSQVLSAVLYSLIAGEPIPGPPSSVGGRITIGLVIASGLASFATVAGTVGAVVAERMRAGGSVIDWEDLEGHLVICGWNSKAEVVVREYREAVQGDEVPIVVISDVGPEPAFSNPSLRKDVHFLDADFTDVWALERAGITRASKCILVSDTSHGRSERDADARTVLAALTVERLNPDIYTCAEVHSRDCVGHLRIAHVDDYVVSGEHSAFLLAQSAVTRGVMGVFQELLTFEYGMKFSAVPVPRPWIGSDFMRAMTVLKSEHDAILVGVRRQDGKTIVNPASHRLAEGEHLVVIAKGTFSLDA